MRKLFLGLLALSMLFSCGDDDDSISGKLLDGIKLECQESDKSWDDVFSAKLSYTKDNQIGSVVLDKEETINLTYQDGVVSKFSVGDGVHSMCEIAPEYIFYGSTIIKDLEYENGNLVTAKYDPNNDGSQGSVSVEYFDRRFFLSPTLYKSGIQETLANYGITVNGKLHTLDKLIFKNDIKKVTITGTEGGIMTIELDYNIVGGYPESITFVMTEGNDIDKYKVSFTWID